MKRVLWADDDSGDQLESIGRLLKRRSGAYLENVSTFEEAVQSIDASLKDGPDSHYHCLLIDTMLPIGPSEEEEDYPGLRVAEYGATNGVEHIAFLSVVPHPEIADRYKALVERFPDVRFHYYHKLSLFQSVAIDDIVNALQLQKEA